MLFGWTRRLGAHGPWNFARLRYPQFGWWYRSARAGTTWPARLVRFDRRTESICPSQPLIPSVTSEDVSGNHALGAAKDSKWTTSNIRRVLESRSTDSQPGREGNRSTGARVRPELRRAPVMAHHSSGAPSIRISTSPLTPSFLDAVTKNTKKIRPRVPEIHE